LARPTSRKSIASIPEKNAPPGLSADLGPSDPDLPITFIIPGVVNFSKAGPGDCGHNRADLACEDGMPGLPGAEGTDNYTAEALTYLSLPAGLTTMGVRSDDGFRLQLGAPNPGDRYSSNAVIVAEFDGGRGAGDTIVTFNVSEAGLYAARLLYEQGGGDANVEWFTFPPAGGTNSIIGGPNTGTNAVLVNDLANGGISAFAAVSAPLAYVEKLDPFPGAANVTPNEGIHLAIADGSVPVPQSGISLILDGVALSPAISKTGGLTAVDYSLPTPWVSQSKHTASIIFSEGSLKFTNTWSFTVQYYISLDASWRVSGVDTNKPGFNWNIFANSDSGNTANNNERAERDLTLQAVDATGAALPNLADPTAVGVAVGPGTAPTSGNGPIHFEIATTINVDIASNNMPGAPSTDATTDGQAAEVTAYLSLPAGVVHMEVDSDDGFRLYAGANPADLFGRAVVGEHNDGTGPWDLSFFVPQAGIYPFRLVWENGTGGSHLIWRSFDSSGNPVLVNDLANGGIPAYRAFVAGTTVTPYVTGATPVPAIHQFEVANTNLTLVLADGTHPVDDTSISLTVDGKSITPVKQRQGNLLVVSDGGAAFPGLQLPADVHTATLIYKDSTGAYSRTNQWNFNNVEILNLPANPVLTENFDEYPEATNAASAVPPGWTAWNYTAENTPGWDLSNKGSDSFLNWVLISTDDVLVIESSSLSYDPNQLINGQPVANFASGNVLWATSDGRSGVQAQFCVSAPFDLSSVTNPVLVFSSLLRMSNGGNAQSDGIEYSIDGGQTWLPGISYVTVAYGSEGYIMLTPDGSIDVVRTMSVPFPTLIWTDPATGQTGGGTFGSALAEPVTQALAPHLVPRSNNTITSTKVDGFRLPNASLQKDVRLRFYQLGSCSWWFGVDNLAFYDVAPPVVAPLVPHINTIQIAGPNVTITWSNGGTLESSPSLGAPVWTTTGNSSGTFTEPLGRGTKFYRVKQ
jgi:hypothetical protein